MLALRAAEKLSIQGKSTTFAPKPAATSLVLSIEPVSTMTTSSNRSAADLRQSGRLSSSFLTIMHRENRGLPRSDVLVTMSVGATLAASTLNPFTAGTEGGAG